MNVVISPDPVLREVCSPVEDVNEVRQLALDMIETMYANSGVGLAAPQVGITKRLFVIDVSDERNDPHVLINPKITWRSDNIVELDEGCLSIPGCSFKVKRPDSCTVEYTNIDGRPMVFDTAVGLLAQCLQHEYDHLEGKTIFENLPPLARFNAHRKYNEALARGAKPGDVE